MLINIHHNTIEYIESQISKMFLEGDLKMFIADVDTLLDSICLNILFRERTILHTLQTNPHKETSRQRRGVITGIQNDNILEEAIQEYCGDKRVARVDNVISIYRYCRSESVPSWSRVESMRETSEMVKTEWEKNGERESSKTDLEKSDEETWS